ncbi:Heterodimeric efflux ABC transporter, permease/ATP-binding subunit 1 [Olavius algarvensis spirochete endosymbiont]|uniref:ABC transporter ATP-binding protein n=1 Tax=Olavius algarvensis spirochete endosymbiont TaxID=260710 RepID=UPI000F2AD4DD|nr:ABC transporter ATP-binding protein [Olavius algarvensis spirochete endosymbiont]CAD7844900.1 MAG: Heterodimeric efflux ABC transporter, permease/ATP-binding subunit 1 [Olavius algarvensis spirochete endosymbiont]VDB00967.1 Heterodimeric efflux ABC transporter, permease/ATP-binding subunit 1 [Olavius algarvensis spirochete endosymbiont]
MNGLRQLNTHLRGRRLLYFSTFIAAAAASFFGLLQPQVVGIVIDVGIGKKTWTGAPWLAAQFDRLNSQNLILYGALFSIALMAISGFFMYLQYRWSAIVAEDTSKRIRERLYNHLQNLDYEYHTKSNTGDLIQRCTSDVDTIRNFLSTQANEVGSGIFLVITTAVLMASLNKPLTFFSMAVFPILFLFGYIFFSKVKILFSATDEAEARLSETLQKNIHGIRVVRAFARADYEIEGFDTKNIEYRDRSFHLTKLLAWYWSISEIMCFSQIGIVMAVGGWWAAGGKITLGTAIVFFTYVGRLLWPVREMGRTLTEMGKAMVSLRRIQEVFDIPPERETGAYQRKIRGEIEFRNVSFQYKNQRPVLRNINCKVGPGEIVGILGPTGSGKSTLVHLLPRLYRPNEGRVLIDSVDAGSWRSESLRSQVCISLQETFLFNRSLRENIILAAPEIADGLIETSTEAAYLGEVIENFEDGYETLVGEGGVTLSGGQKQRVAIARTLIRLPRVIILDDCFSAVDTQTGANILAEIRKRFIDTTIFIVTHQVSTLKEVDRILILENGGISHEGSHEELIRGDNLYRRIWDIQNVPPETDLI